MFKSFTPYTLEAPAGADLLSQLRISAELLASPSSAAHPRTVGLVPPHPQDPYVIEHPVGRDGMVMLCMQTETRTAPASVLRERVEQQCRQIEQATGTKPGRRQRREVTEAIRQDMLGAAFPRKRRTLILLAPRAGLVLVEGTSTTTTDEALSLLARALPVDGGIGARQLRTHSDPLALMDAWVQDGTVGDIEAGQRLQMFGRDGEAVTYTDVDLRAVCMADQIADHTIHHGYEVGRLEITWRRRVTAYMDAALCMRRVRLLDTPDDIAPSEAADDWSCTALITAAELIAFVSDLVDNHLGGREP